ncbi:MAG: hypothetical protein NZ932_05125 [Candidatus Bathyarchaeota archaeon]|nr:hypothetical protein [Candidatus Bathyarchaeota archaeon]
MGTVPEQYYQFIMEFAPHVYVVPPGTPDQTWGKAAFAAAFAIDFLYEAYSAEQFSRRKNFIYDKIVSLADWILTQQCVNSAKKAYGGFKSTENSQYYYAVDACRVIPSLLKAYELTDDADYLDSAKLAGGIFLKTMQDQQPQYGGFARAVDYGGNGLLELDVECLYGLIGLRMLAEKYDVANAGLYRGMMERAVGFLREGLEGFWLWFSPADGKWHRVGLRENHVYDDCLAYALLGLYEYEGWSATCQKVYGFINSIGASAQYPAYNPAVCWAGYLDVVSRCPACDYYDTVTAGILWKVRQNHDKPSLAFSKTVIEKHWSAFMYWGVRHADYAPVEGKWAMATVCWLGRLFLNCQEPTTRFTQVLRAIGETLTLYPAITAGEGVAHGGGVEVQAVVNPARADEVLLEPGYVLNDYIAVYSFTPLRHRDRVRWRGLDYEVLTVQTFTWKGEAAYFKAVCRRLLG